MIELGANATQAGEVQNSVRPHEGVADNSSLLPAANALFEQAGKYFEDKKKIIIAVDNDPPGLALQQELIRRLGAEVCFISTFDDCKDANEYLLKHGSKELMSRIKQAHPVPLENVTTFRDIEDEVTDFVRNGFKRGFTVGLHNFDKIFMVGGGSRSSFWIELLSTLLNKKLSVCDQSEYGAALGVARLAMHIDDGIQNKEDIIIKKFKELVELSNSNNPFILKALASNPKFIEINDNKELETINNRNVFDIKLNSIITNIDNIKQELLNIANAFHNKQFDFNKNYKEWEIIVEEDLRNNGLLFVLPEAFIFALKQRRSRKFKAAFSLHS